MPFRKSPKRSPIKIQSKNPRKSPRVGPYSQKSIENQRIKAKNEMKFDDNGTFGLVPVSKVKEQAQTTGW